MKITDSERSLMGQLSGMTTVALGLAKRYVKDEETLKKLGFPVDGEVAPNGKIGISGSEIIAVLKEHLRK